MTRLLDALLLGALYLAVPVTLCALVFGATGAAIGFAFVASGVIVARARS